jgi:hypothetical protein
MFAPDPPPTLIVCPEFVGLCEELVQEIDDPQLSAEWSEMAQTWRALKPPANDNEPGFVVPAG